MKSSRLFLSILCGCILAVPNVLGAPAEVAYCSNSVESEKAVSKSAINVKSEIAPLKKVWIRKDSHKRSWSCRNSHCRTFDLYEFRRYCTL